MIEPMTHNHSTEIVEVSDSVTEWVIHSVGDGVVNTFY